MLGELHSFGCQLVDVGRFDFLLPVAADFGVAEVVGEEIDDVWFGFGYKPKFWL